MTLSWRRVLEMVRKEARQLLRDPRTRVAMFVAPMIQLVVFGYAVNTDIPNTATAIVDHDRTRASRELIDAFASTEYFAVVARPARSADLAAALDRGDAIVGIDNAERIYLAARHPKSFVSLGSADHLVSEPRDARFLGHVLSAWAGYHVDGG